MRIFCHLLFFMLLIGLISGCSNTPDNGEFIDIQPAEDPMILPYIFHITDRISETHPTFILPIKITSDSTWGSVLFGYNWIEHLEISNMVLYNDPFHQKALKQVNVKTAGFYSPKVHDVDNDSIDEVIICYGRHDSLWLEIHRAEDDSIYTGLLFAGEDRDGNGYWDGHGAPVDFVDINGDGNDEIIIHIDTGYDLYPRRLMCLDWANDSILWTYDHANIINIFNTYAVPDPFTGGKYIVVGLSSKGNAAVSGDMDDRHAHFVVLDESGRELWKKSTGGVFTLGLPIIIEYDDDPMFEIAAGHNTIIEISGKDTTVIRSCRLVVYDHTGAPLDSIIFDNDKKITDLNLMDIDSDGTNEITVIFSDNSMFLLDQRLRITGRYKFSSTAHIWDCRDFLGTGENQLLINIHDNQLILTDSKFNILAQFTDENTLDRSSHRAVRNYPDNNEWLFYETNRNGIANYILTIKKSPWYTIFSRKPLLAFLAAFVPLSIVIAIIWLIMAKFRQKNRIIEEQKDRLNQALIDLHATQNKLIAAEKYKQAKDIAGGVAHEIHNALFPARSSLDQLKNRLDMPGENELERNRKLLNLSEKAVNRALKMVDLVKVYSRLASEKSSDKVNLREIVNEIIDANKLDIEQNRIEISAKVEDDLFIACQRSHLFSLVNNIFLNAIQAVLRREKRFISVSAKREKRQIRLIISDTGPGIPEDKTERIFDTFYTTRPSGGTGLGLSIVRKIAELYDASIEVKSILDKGTDFIILFKAD